MSNDVEKTSPPAPLYCVLAIHCSGDLLRRVIIAAGRAGLSARECDLREMGRQATQRRPLAMIVPSYLHEFDPTEFDALARDVGAVLVVVDEALEQAELDALVAGAGLRRLRSPRPTQGRYQMVGGCAAEATQVGPPTNTCVRLRVERRAVDDVETVTSRAG